MGSSKGLSQTLWIVMAAVVIVVVAIVMLVIFGGAMDDTSILMKFENRCRVTATASCQTTGILPLTWQIKETLENGQQKSCSEEFSGWTCDNFRQTTETE